MPKILAIDTSCDETSASVVHGTKILSNVQPSQIEFHKKYGGVVPSVARLAHTERIDNVVTESLKRAKTKIEEIDLIAVTKGPGLAIALEVGIKKAKELAIEYSKPLIPINHMEGHLLSPLSNSNSENKKKEDIKFPVLGILVSGKHTEFVYVEDIMQYKKIGETRDDSCGECFDKCGRMLGLGYPAGPVITQFSKEQRPNVKITIAKRNLTTLVQVQDKKTKETYELPIPMAQSGDLDMSYSGLKTAFRDLVMTKTTGDYSEKEVRIDGVTGLDKSDILNLCVVLEAAAYFQITNKLESAINQYKPKEVWLGGGVVASPRLRSVVRSTLKKHNIKLRFPYSKKLTTDNAAMIGVAANLRMLKLKDSHNVNLKSPKNTLAQAGIFIDQKDIESIDRDPSMSL
jgi:N6-L-threonylcarbamoyladenine synthase